MAIRALTSKESSPGPHRTADGGLVRRSRVGLDVEVVALRLDRGQLQARVVRSGLGHDEHPDDAALRLVGALVGPTTVSHSTSWRFEAEVLVVTYAVLPDPCWDQSAVAVGEIAVVTSGRLARPGPAALHLHHVIAHAICHLALLRDRDPFVEQAATAENELWTAVSATARTARTTTIDHRHCVTDSKAG